MISPLLILSILASASSRQYPACAKWCGKHSSSSSSSYEQPAGPLPSQECENACPTGMGPNCKLQFDPTMFATSIDEALYNFPNLVSQEKRPMFNKAPATPATPAPSSASVQQATLQQEDVESFGPQIQSAPLPTSIDVSEPGQGFGIQSSTIEDNDDDCSSVMCRSCKLHVINGFLDGPVDPATNVTLWATRESLEATLNGITPSCPQNAPPQLPPSPPRRGKRQAAAANSVMESDTGLVGSTQTISCDYTRGNPVNTDTRFCGLCSLCWGWRQLPEDYFPNYLNEVLCSRDTTCLQGFGRCNPVTKSINVLRKKFDASGAFKYEQTTIDTVEYGSTIFNLVYANDAAN